MRVSGGITLTTDFGLQDPYVGIMKGVIFSVNPDARVIDISHQVRAGDISQASGLIQEAYPFFPKRTVHVGVVDPGVGGKRRPIVVDAGEQLFVGPDNGLFWPIITRHPGATIIHLERNKYFLPRISKTFHGRDIFAPVAAYLSCGVDPSEMGSVITDPISLEFPEPRREGDIIRGQIIRVDHFGNLITNIRKDLLKPLLGRVRPVIRLGDLTIEGVRETYSDVGEGEILALMGSSDCLEIAVNLGRVSDRLGLDSENLPEAIMGMTIEVAKSQTS